MEFLNLTDLICIQRDCFKTNQKNLIGGESNPIPGLSALDQLRVHTVAAAGDIQHLGESHFGVVSERNTNGHKRNVTREQGGDGVIPNLDLEHTFNHLESGRTGQRIGGSLILGLATEGDGRKSVVGILSLLGSHKRLNNLIAVLGAQVLGPVAVRQEVRLARVSERIVASVPFRVVDRGGAVDQIATGLETELGVYVELLQRRNDASIRR